MSDQLQTDARAAADSPSSPVSPGDSRRRSQAVAGGFAGLAVVLILVSVFIAVQLADRKPAPTAAAPSAAPAAPATPAPTETTPTPTGVSTPAALKDKPVVKAGGSKKLTKLKVTLLVRGDGPPVTSGQNIITNYVLVQYQTGKLIQSTWDMGQTVPLTVGQLIPGFNQGIVGVPMGSRVQMDIPAALAYGTDASGGAPAGDLRFVVDILTPTR